MKIKDFIPTKQTTWQKILGISLCLVFLMACSGGLGGVVGVFWATGSLPPFLAEPPEVIVPDIPEETTTLVEIGHFLERDKTNEIEYQEGFNCKDYGLVVATVAHWEGLPALVGRLVYENTLIAHAILIFPTEEDGWVFVDPQSDLVINPRPGVIYNGQRIERIDIFRGYWEVFWE